MQIYGAALQKACNHLLPVADTLASMLITSVPGYLLAVLTIPPLVGSSLPIVCITNYW